MLYFAYITFLAKKISQLNKHSNFQQIKKIKHNAMLIGFSSVILVYILVLILNKSGLIYLITNGIKIDQTILFGAFIYFLTRVFADIRIVVAQNLSMRQNLTKLYIYQILISLICMPVLCSFYGGTGVLISLTLSYFTGFLVKLDKNKMLISIITVVKNDLVRLKKTISSLNYIYNDINFEHVIVDGFSIDNTLPFLKNLKRKNNNIIIDSSLDLGIYDAMNRGYELSSGDFIIFLNAGDKLIANKKYLINTLKKFMKTGINIICFPFNMNYQVSTILRYPKSKNKDKLPTSHQAMFFSNSFLEKNKYSLDYKDCI